MWRVICGYVVAEMCLVPVAALSQEAGADAGVTLEQEESKELQVDKVGIENTLDFCTDGLDNDGDSHVDCDDQDCEIYAICVKEDEENTEAVEVAEPEQQPEETADESEDEIIHRPFSIGFVPGLTTDGGADGKTRNNFSLNFIGWGDYLTGADVSFIGGIRKRDVKGFQGAGIFNYTNGSFTGFQGSGIADVTRGSFTGFQASGIASVSLSEFTGFQGAGIASFSRGDSIGFQGAGIASVTAKSFTGFQGAGIANVATGPFVGFQGAGISNFAYSMRGAQISGIANVASGDVTGLQAGLINYGTRVKGAQIGLINIAAKEMKGAPIGLISFAGDGILAPTLWGSDNSMLNVGLKMGSRWVYGLLGYGIHPVGDEKRDSFISGIGGHIDFDPAWVEIDLVSHWLHEDFDWYKYDGNDNFDTIHKLRATIGYRVVDQLSLFAGPTLNLLVSQVRDDADLIPAFACYSQDDWNVKLSLGFIAGLQWEPKWGRLNSK